MKVTIKLIIEYEDGTKVINDEHILSELHHPADIMHLRQKITNAALNPLT